MAGKRDDGAAPNDGDRTDERVYEDDWAQQLLAVQSNAIGTANRSLLVFATDPDRSRPTPEGGTGVAAKAGENARETGDFRCEKCHNKVHVTQGDRIPMCPECGNDTFDVRTGETS